MESLCVCDSKSTEVDLEHEERQQALLELCAADGLQHYSEDRLIRLAMSAAFYRVCEAVYQRRRQYDEIVACYWRDPARRHLTFSYVQSIVANKAVSSEERARLNSAVTSAVSELVKIDARRTAKLLLVTLGVSATEVIQHLDSQDQEVDADQPVFSFLSGVFDFVASTPDIQSTLDSSVHERYVKIMCRLRHPSPRIVEFLRTTSGYRLTEMLSICRRYSVSDAIVCLLEKSGDIRGAFDILFDRLTRSAVQTNTEEGDVEVQLEELVEDVVGLLQRGSRQLEQSELETVWFKLLDFLMDATKLVKIRSTPVDDAAERLKSVTRQVINAMMAHVALPAVLQRIIANEGGVAGHFGDVRDLLTGVLDACSYERTLMGTCARLVNQDLHCAIASLMRASRRATVPLTDTCLLCGRSVLAGASTLRPSQDIVCFHCGHVVHRICLLTCTVTSPGASRDPAAAGVEERRWKCPVCCRSTSLRPPTLTAPPLGVQSHHLAATSPAHSSAVSSSQPDPVQLDSIDRLRCVSRAPSRLTVLAELAQLEHTRTSSVLGHSLSKGVPHSSILRSDQFALRLAAPPPPNTD